VLRRGAAPPSDRLAEGLAQIEASVVRVDALVDELVEVATLEEGGTLPFRPALIDLVALVRQSVDRH
jgi:signal transduction histidine kinase